MAGFSTSKGTIVHYNLTGWNKTATETVTKFTEVLSFSGLDISRELIKEINLETDTEVTGSGKTVVSDIEIVFRVASADTTTYKLWFNALTAGTDLTLKCFLPLGTGVTFLANVTLTKVSTPIEAGGFLHITLGFSVAGTPTLLP
uniref:hypothetical protein n=1 Tax=Shewanella sp. TaxID=50422 RepID=UPI004047590B